MFEKKEDGNIYVNVDGEEILVYINDKDSFSLDFETLTLSGFDNQCNLKENLTDIVILQNVASSRGFQLCRRMASMLTYGNQNPLLSNLQHIVLEDENYAGLHFLWEYYQSSGLNITHIQTLTINLTGEYGYDINRINLEVVESIDKLIVNSRLDVEIVSCNSEIRLGDLEIVHAPALKIKGPLLLDFDQLVLPTSVSDLYIDGLNVRTSGDFTMNIPFSMQFNRFKGDEVSFIVYEDEVEGKKIPSSIVLFFVPNMGSYKLTLEFDVREVDAQFMYGQYIARIDDESSNQYIVGWLAKTLENLGPVYIEEIIYETSLN